MNKMMLETAQQLLATKEFSYKDINPSEKGIFLVALIENGKVAKEGTNHHSNIPKGTLISEWYLRHKLGLSGAIKHDLYTSLELWELDDKRYQIIYYKPLKTLPRLALTKNLVSLKQSYLALSDKS